MQKTLMIGLLIAFGLVSSAVAQPAENRIALVIGNAAYQSGALQTPANDAGLVAQTLQAAGFDVVGARDLDQDSLRRAFRDFVEKVRGAGPNTIAFIYLSGYGLQLEGENYLVPVDAKILSDSDVTVEALRISDFVRPLASLRLKASIVVLDAARANPFARSGAPLAGGLALVDPEPGMLLAFNAAPGTVAPEGQGPYGPYAQALAEMMREGGLPLGEIFDRLRLRVNDLTKGAQVPWYASKIDAPVVLFERAPDAPPLAAAPDQTAAFRSRAIRDLSAQEAYVAALERDTMQGYLDFLAAYPDDPMARRVQAIVAARREAITWRRTRMIDTPEAYWSYLRRYPRGPHAADARRRLAFLTAALEPPPSFAVVEYDVPPPPPDEFVYFERPVLVFDDPDYAFAPPPPPPIYLLPPPPPEFYFLPPPPPPVALFVLPIPIYRPVPVWVRPPAYVRRPPPNNIIYNNIHNTVVINNTTNVVTITNQSGQTKTLTPQVQPVGPASKQGKQGGTLTPTTTIGPSLPPSVAQKAITIQNQGPQGPGTGQPGGQPLPGTKGLQLPSTGQPGQPLPGVKGLQGPIDQPGTKGTAPTTGTGQPQIQQQQLEQQKLQKLELEKKQKLDLEKQQQLQLEQQKLQKLELEKKQKLDLEKQQQLQLEQQKLQKLELEKKQKLDLEKQKQLQIQQQQHQQQIEQQRLQDQRKLELEKQHQLQIQQQQHQQQLEQQRLQEQRKLELDKQHQQQIQQQQIQQQRQQQIQQQQIQQQQIQQQQQRQQQIQQQQIQQQQQHPAPPKPACGGPGQPACPK
jgi:uncharacterized caspase-like protein